HRAGRTEDRRLGNVHRVCGGRLHRGIRAVRLRRGRPGGDAGATRRRVRGVRVLLEPDSATQGEGLLDGPPEWRSVLCPPVRHRARGGGGPAGNIPAPRPRGRRAGPIPAEIGRASCGKWWEVWWWPASVT